MTVQRAVEWLTRAGTSAPLAVILLVGTNLVPLVGVLFLGWDVFTILLLYWLENGIVGLVNLAKITLARGAPTLSPGGPRLGISPTLQKAALVPFFAVHYGVFWLVHGAFVVMFTLVGSELAGGDGGVAIEGVALSGLGLLVSHLVSLRTDYIGRGEYRRISPAAQFAEPYPRMVVLHVTIIAGGFIVMGLGQPILLIALLIVLKTALDLVLHLRAHARLAQAQPAAAELSSAEGA